MKLKITLMSDLCTGNGTGYGSLVDTETCYDEYGLPYIPGRRVKGLLREAALELQDWDDSVTDEMINEMFGEPGESFQTGSKLKLYDFKLDKYDDYVKDIQANPTLENRNRVLKYFTYIRYQTSIDENGIAKENSLRSTRVVKKGTIFMAPIDNLTDEIFLKKLCNFVHHMGLSRTRGYGEVKLDVISSRDDQPNHQAIKLNDDTYYQLELDLKNEVPLIISQGNTMKSIDYINGASILGYFAGAYLRDHDDGERFRNLFINGKLIFSNAYPSTSDYQTLMPNFLSLKKVKDGHKYYDDRIQAIDNRDVQLSRISNKYMCFDTKDEHKKLHNVSKEMVYHHRRPDDKSIGHVVENAEGMGTFYQLEAISSNQHFKGFMSGLGKDLKELLPYIGTSMTIGKSKDTQYGLVDIEKVDVHEVKETIMTDEIIAYLASPTVLLNPETLTYTEDKKTLSETLSKTMNVEFKEDKSSDKKENSSAVGYTTYSGYNAKWNLPKDAMKAFKQGSILRIKLNKPQALQRHYYIGLHTQEGLGHVYIFTLDELKKRHFGQFDDACEQDKEEQVIENMKQTKLYKFCLEDKYMVEVMRLMNDFAFKNQKKLNSSTIGRLLLMLKEAKETNKGKDDAKYFREEYVKTIKTDAKSNIAQQLFEQCDATLKDIEVALEKNPEVYDKIHYKAYRELLLMLKYLNREVEVNE